MRLVVVVGRHWPLSSGLGRPGYHTGLRRAGSASIPASRGQKWALGRKGARRVVVDGTVYRWRLRRRPTYSQALCWSPCTYAVEHADHPGTTLVVTTNQPHLSNWLGGLGSPVLPSDVADAIASALRQGWLPTRPGSPFQLDQSADFSPLP